MCKPTRTTRFLIRSLLLAFVVGTSVCSHPSAGPSVQTFHSVKSKNQFTLLPSISRNPQTEAHTSSNGAVFAVNFVLQYWNQPSDPKSMSQVIDDPAQTGLTLHDLMSYFRAGKHGKQLGISLLPMNVELLKLAVDHGLTPIVGFKTKHLAKGPSDETISAPGSLYFAPVIGYGSSSLLVASSKNIRIVPETDLQQAVEKAGGQWILIWATDHHPNPDGSDEVQSLFQNGVRLFQQEHLNRAWKVFQQVSERNPFFAKAFGNMGMIAFKKGNYHEAKDLFRKALSRNPGLYSVRNHLAYTYFLQRRKLEKALQHTNTVIQDNLPRLSRFLSKHVNQQDLKIVKQTKSNLRRIISEAYHIRGRTYQTLDRPDSARSDFHQSLLISQYGRKSFRATLFRLLGETQRSLKQFEEALFSFRKAMSLTSNHKTRKKLKKTMESIKEQMRTSQQKE